MVFGLLSEFINHYATKFSSHFQIACSEIQSPLSVIQIFYISVLLIWQSVFLMSVILEHKEFHFSQWNKNQYCKSWFLSLAGIDLLDWIMFVLILGSVLYIAGYLTASQSSAPQIPESYSSLLWQPKVSRHCQMFPDRQSLTQMRTTAVNPQT